MSYEKLKELGFFLPEERWGELEMTGSVSRWWMTLLAAAALAACTLMWWGAGSAWTWAGAALFIAFLGGFTWLSIRGVERQNRRLAELTRKGSRRRSSGS